MAVAASRLSPLNSEIQSPIITRVNGAAAMIAACWSADSTASRWAKLIYSDMEFSDYHLGGRESNLVDPRPGA